jgi:hypothetical protein
MIISGTKLSLYEGGHRVPFIISGPGVARGRVDHSLAHNVDWLPTLAALAGVSIEPDHKQGLRGVDLSPILLQDQLQSQNAPSAFHRPPVFWRGGGGGPPCWNRSPPLAMRDGDWKLLFAGRQAPRALLARGALQRERGCARRSGGVVPRVLQRSQVPARRGGGNACSRNGLAQQRAVPLWAPQQQQGGLLHVV